MTSEGATGDASPLSPVALAFMSKLGDGRAQLELADAELMHVVEMAQHQAGNEALAAELLAIARKLHAAGGPAVVARDQCVILAAVVLGDMELNGAICKRLYAKKRDMASVIGHPDVHAHNRPVTTSSAPSVAGSKSVLSLQLAALAGIDATDTKK